MKAAGVRQSLRQTGQMHLLRGAINKTIRDLCSHETNGKTEEHVISYQGQDRFYGSVPVCIILRSLGMPSRTGNKR